MVMRFFLVLLSAFLWCASLFAADPVSIVTDDHGITVVINRVQVHAEHSSTQSTLRIDSRYSFAPFGASVDALELSVALPDASLPTTELVIGREEAVSAVPYPGGDQSFEPSVELHPVGVQRGVHIALLKISPYRYDAVSRRMTVVTSGQVYVKFATALPKSTESSKPEPDAYFFSSIVNKEHIPAIRRNSVRPLGLTTIDESNSWYTKDGVFVRLATTRDGVARARYEDIVAVEPAFAGIPSRNVKLLHNGVAYPLFLRNDNDEVFNAGDEIVFMGRRAYGDTTWFDHYTSECAFFLTIAQGEPPLRLSLIEQPDNAPTAITAVLVDDHIEQDREYHLGDDVFNNHIATLHRTETVAGEGWYWGDFSYNPSGGSGFEHLQVITPSDDPADILTIGYHYHAKSNNRSYTPNHLTGYQLNGIEVGRDEPYEGYRDVSFEADVPAAELFAGANLLRLRALGVPEHRQQPNYTEVAALDYFTLKGKAKPFAWQGALAFSTEILTANSTVAMAGFSAPGIYAVDTLASTIVRLQGTSGTTVRLGAQTGNTMMSSVSINDSIAAFSPSVGISIAVVSPSNFSKPEVVSYADPSATRQQILDKLQQAPTGSIIAIASSGVDIPSDVRSAILAMGSTQAQTISTRTAWIFAVRKGGAVATEHLATDGVASGSAFIEHEGGASYTADMRLPGGMSYQFITTDDRAVETVPVTRVNHLDLRDDSYQADVIIVAHRDFMESADSLARYRRAHNGVSVKVVDTEDIYKQFSYGRKSPHAIKQFLAYAYSNWSPPKLRYLVLFGDASWDARNVSEGSITHDFVPVYGRPVSDYWYTLIDGDDWLPEFAVGRLSVDNTAQAKAVVDKIVEYEALQKRPWMKKFLLLAGGQGAQERRFFRNNTLLQMDNYLTVPPLCPMIDTVFKDNDDQASVSQASQIRNRINAGALWVSYVGHASPVTFDMDFGKASDLSNGNRYPVLATYSCQTAAFAEPTVTGKNEDFVREPDKGFIGAFGTTGFGEVNVDYETAKYLYKAILEDSLRALGDILLYAKSRMGVFAENDYIYQNTLSQHSLIGDPLLSLTIDRTTDLYLLEDDITITTASGSPVVSENDSVATLHSWLRNAGMQAKFYEDDTLPHPVEVLVTHEYEGKRDSLWIDYDELCADIPFSLQLRIAGQPGVHYLTLYADPNKYSPETNRTNNIVFDTLVVYPARAFALDPLPYWNVDAETPVFRLVNPLNIDSLALEFAVSDHGSPDEAFLVSTIDDIRYTEAYTQWNAPVELAPGASYWLHVRTKDKRDEYGAWVDIPFTASRDVPTAEAQWTLRRSAHFDAGTSNGFTTEEKGDSVELSLHNYTVPVRLRSNGNSNERDLLIEVNNVTIVDKSTYRSGFNVAVLPRGATVPRVYRWYYTFPIENPAAEYNSSDLIRFLRDSVAEGETLLLAVYDEAFAGPATKDNNTDSLADVLKLYGSQITDSLLAEGGWRGINSSYALIAKRGQLLAEAWKKDTVTKTGVEIVSDIDIENLGGALQTPMAGPATQWQSFQLGRYGDAAGVSWKTKVIGRQADGAEQELSVFSGTTVDLSFVDAALYPYMRFEVEVERTSADVHPVLTSLQCSFVPTAELATLHSGTGPLTNDVLRGENIEFSTRIQNISRRVASLPSRVDIDIRPKSPYNAPPVLFTKQLPVLDPDAIYEYETPVATAALAPVSSVEVAAYAGEGEEELYLFNNRQKYELRSYEDTVKPIITVEMDGRLLHDNDYVALHPATLIRVADNSPLRISAAEKVAVRLNGKYIDSDEPNMADYLFTALPSGEEHAHVSFIALLEPGYNSLRVVAEDATGNRDTLDVTFVVVEKPVIEKFKTMPNPFNEQIEVKFLVGDQQEPADGEAVVYNTTGRLVRRIPLRPHIGQNNFYWDATDAEQRRVADGVYLIRVYVRGSGGALESQTQKVVLVQ